MLRLTCGAVRDGKHIQSFAKFQLKIHIHFQIDIFLSVAVLTSKDPYSRLKLNFDPFTTFSSLSLFFSGPISVVFLFLLLCHPLRYFSSIWLAGERNKSPKKTEGEEFLRKLRWTEPINLQCCRQKGQRLGILVGRGLQTTSTHVQTL